MVTATLWITVCVVFIVFIVFTQFLIWITMEIGHSALLMEIGHQLC